MKTTIFIFACLLFLTGIPCSAQITALQKGSFLVGGGADLSFASYKSEITSPFITDSYKSSVNFITLSPQVGYFVADGFTIGGLLNLSRSASKDDGDDGKYILSDITIGPFLRYYTPSKIFFHGEYTFGKETEKITGSYNDESSANLSAWKLGIGYAAFLNKNISLEPHVMYASNTRKRSDEYTVKSTVGQLTLGVNFTLFLTRD